MKKSAILLVVFIFIIILIAGFILLSIASVGFSVEEARIGRFILEEDIIFEDESRMEKITEVYENTSDKIVVKEFEELNYMFNSFDKKRLSDNQIRAIENQLGEEFTFKTQMKGSPVKVDCRPGYKCWVEFTPKVRRISGVYESLDILTRKISRDRISLSLPTIENNSIGGKSIIRQEKSK